MYTSNSKLSPEYWGARLFKNTYTYRGRRFAARKWCVKIQLRGIRRTFSLSAPARGAAAAEAARIYRRLLRHGWARAKSGTSGPAPLAVGAAAERPRPSIDPSRPAYWSRRLVRRQYGMALRADGPRELSARLEHGGAGFYFPLGTLARRVAALRAARLYCAIAAQGWEAVLRRFPRELTLAFHWSERPLAWTYTTIQTCRRFGGPRLSDVACPKGGIRSVAILERDRRIGDALAWCVDHMQAFGCAGVFESPGAALRGLRRCPIHLLLANTELAAEAGTSWLRELLTEAPALMGVPFSVYEDSEDLFRSTPGGATTYCLQRTPCNQFLAPMATAEGSGAEGARHAIWRYFQNALSAPSVHHPYGPLPSLTQREHSVLGLLGAGARDKDIADSLGISIYTVHEHVSHIFAKLGVHNRTEAVVKFLQK